MTDPDAAAWLEAAEATWPAAARHDSPGFVLREGRGGGQRVSAATARVGWSEADIPAAEAGMRALGQSPLFQVRGGEDALDVALEARGYAKKDPVTILAAPVALLADIAIPRVTVFALWEPLAIQRELWAAAGVGADRLAVMERAASPKTALLGRLTDKPAGAGFCAISDGRAVLHALEIAPDFRRAGLGRLMTAAAAQWAAGEGARSIGALCVDANAAAVALYGSLGFTPVARYHYRTAPPAA
ncbi:acetyltransferase [Roseivivax marinus]|uniref:Acetyltransferase n=1 Tax=Roseivivax marinus TaxID=1379903 RepID=W4HH94_9RHOB|nr:GNAT family N-acetyltransferase [Roseivivax marinus]ETW12122.1 acetyltransferase [Roseivivax marinus]